MEWLILLVGVPAILVPIVLLCGFAGCGLSVVGTGVPTVLAPSNLHAVRSTNRDGIVLTWLNNEPDTARFEIQRTKLRPPQFLPEASEMLPENPTVAVFVDRTATAGISYQYEVRAITSTGTASAFSNPSSATMFPATPVLTAVPTDVDQIDLAWTAPTEARIEHRPLPVGGGRTPIYQGPPPFEHKNLLEGSRHEYVAVAIIDGVTDSVPGKVESFPTIPPVEATTRRWEQCYPSGPLSSAPDVNVAGSCVVQRISAERLSQGGTSVRIALQAPPNQVAKLTAVYISRAVPAGAPQPWNSADQPVEVQFNGSSGVTLQNGVAGVSDKTRFQLDPDEDLIIAFDVAPDSQAVRGRSGTGLRVYVKGNAAEAAVRDRSAGYQTNDNLVYCVTRIDVA